MKLHQTRALAAASSVAVLLALGACGQRTDVADAQDNLQQTRQQAMQDIQQAQREAQEQVHRAHQEAMEDIRRAREELRQAQLGSGQGTDQSAGLGTAADPTLTPVAPGSTDTRAMGAAPDSTVTSPAGTTPGYPATTR